MKTLVVEHKGKKLEVFSKDLQKTNWYFAKKHCVKIGVNWRLPNEEEMQTIFKSLFKKDLGELRGFYWCMEGTAVNFRKYKSNLEDVEGMPEEYFEAPISEMGKLQELGVIAVREIE